jgi:hypothetical protein
MCKRARSRRDFAAAGEIASALLISWGEASVVIVHDNSFAKPRAKPADCPLYSDLIFMKFV